MSKETPLLNNHWLAAVAAWTFPGLGHFLLGPEKKGIALLRPRFQCFGYGNLSQRVFMAF